MVVRREKKVRKQRGNRQHGYGRISGGHRASGARGGKGEAGRFKQHLIHHLKAGTAGVRTQQVVGRGFVRYKKLVQDKKIWNVETLNHYLSSTKIETKGTPEINLADLGVDKLLGKGQLQYKVNVTVTEATELAMNKIKQAGGKCNVGNK
ncbi:MAG: uL15 family ribosomal protein [Candidatus Thorarchaeota archaeon]